MDEIARLMKKPEFPRSSKYDADWMLENQMGPNAVWLMEWLVEELHLEPGMRVLDLGCGKALSSIFLAKELGVRVWAADLWIGPDNNWRRAREAGVEDLVCPVKMEAHALPFAREFFDAVVSIDAYTYFGTDSLYLGYVSSFIRPGGEVGIVVPGLARPLEGDLPPHLTEPQGNGKVFWEDECWCFKPPEFWAGLWGRSSRVKDVKADALADGWRHWRDFERAVELSGNGVFPSDAEALDTDGGRHIALVRATATRTDVPAENMYDPCLGARFGVDS